MLSIEMKSSKSADSKEVVEVYLDYDGLSSLMAQLNLLNNRKADHVDLMSHMWGGTHLEDKPHNVSNLSIRHLKILLLRDPI